MSLVLPSGEPPMKKQKKDELIDEEISSTDNIISQYIKKVLNTKSNLTVVLADEYLNPIPLTKAYAGFIKDVKNISNTMKVLNEKMPLKELIHLKRVRGPNIIICHVNDFSTSSSLQEFIKSNIPELIDVFEQFTEVDVPAYMPKLKWQYKEICKTWACNFHPDVYLEKLTSGDFIKADLQTHRTFMAMNFEIIKFFNRNVTEVDETILSTVNASVVVDPSINSVVAVSFDNRLKHPVQHSAMMAIDNVANTQGGGSWSVEDSRDTCQRGIDKDLLEHLKSCFPQVKFGAKKHFRQNNIGTEAEKDYSAPYLCTNYYIYLLREPCIMCSMALTHARVKRVFYCFENKDFGALSSRAKLHTVPFLNHRYEVFTGFL